MRMRSIFLMALLLLVGATVGAYVVATTPFVGAQDQVSAAADTAVIGTAFTYQGRLTDKGNPANGTYDFVFELYDDADANGTQIGNTVSRGDVEVVDGYFSVQLDFGNVFTGAQIYLEIGTRPGSSDVSYTKLLPRRAILPSPYAQALPWATFQGNSATIDGQLRVNGAIYMTADDLAFLPNARGDGGRALVRALGDTLVVNFAGDFVGGTTVDGKLLRVNGDTVVVGNIGMHGTDFKMGPNERGEGGRAMVHGEGDSLVLNFGPDFDGGTIVGSRLQVNGDTNILGNLSKSSGSFKIDHPLDPTNKYLYHSFIESPDMMNIYNGNVTLDANGEAWVQMPEWFEALNQEFRYQLTPIGAPGPNLYIAQTITDNRFRIAGGAVGATVSWQVTGIRHDPYAEANRIPVEEEKPSAEVGTYLHPEVYGAPAEQGVYFQRPESSLAE